ncbi:MAG: toll/interleukin-1 receptor domain-containing protein [Candidatus Saccharimonas sp.]|nr:toll/interleukin-1 receptor domain-containing protein [Planctomycetaceae bacterium]
MKVFLSHSKSDKTLAREIAQGLVDQGFDVWFDEWFLQPGGNWAKAVGKALESADAMVVLVSPDSMQSWQREDIHYALTTPRFEGRLIPVIVKSTPDIPWILETLNVVRPGRTGAETARRIADALQPVTAG